MIQVPENSLSFESLQVVIPDKTYTDWDDRDHYNSFYLLQKIGSIWKKSGIAEQYLVYGKHEVRSKTFHWEMVPYAKTSSFLIRFWKQFQVLWNITFGGGSTNFFDKKENLFKEHDFLPTFEDNPPAQTDAFCTLKVIEKQSVLEGKEVRVLYNYAPIGFGGDRLHFLITPKKHRTGFQDLSSSEYLETMDLSKKLITHFSKDAYLFHKTGKEAGQTVPHFHLHLIFTSNKAQDFFGKITVLRNMLLGSFPLSDGELRKKVGFLRREFNDFIDR